MRDEQARIRSIEDEAVTSADFVLGEGYPSYVRERRQLWRQSSGESAKRNVRHVRTFHQSSERIAQRS